MEKRMMNVEELGTRAVDAFYEGYNCCQAVVKAFAEEPEIQALGIPEETLLSMASSFGGGMGRLREVCGAVSAMFMLYGLLHGYGTPETGETKRLHYVHIQDLSEAFLKRQKSIVCRDLLNLPPGPSVPVPEPRIDRYYDTRPCPKIVRDAAEVLADYLNREEA